eukprot:TRINITY_DN4145_c0_g1_i1.p1 TRINITY_DN4145_c0_g1~~TRINITY_DN4145_c0_g1_i1.p1  ORF type:complete len:369 (+),score=53.42 TRINITY_DN4145_c0_g1_i1:148-1254(+)
MRRIHSNDMEFDELHSSNQNASQFHTINIVEEDVDSSTSPSSSDMDITDGQSLVTALLPEIVTNTSTFEKELLNPFRVSLDRSRSNSISPVMSAALEEEPPVSRRRFYIIVALVFALMAGLFFLNQQWMNSFLDTFFHWVKSIGYWGNFLFCFLFVVISFPFILGGYIPLALGAGALYGIVLGTITISIGSTLGACLTFWASRAIGKKWVERKMKSTREFHLFELLLQGKNQYIVTFLVRLAPIPFGLQNSFFALTSISFRDYFISTFIGLLPCQLVWTHLGTTLRNLSKITSGEVELSFWQYTSLVLQVVILVSLVAYFVIISRKMKEREQDEATTHPNEEHHYERDHGVWRIQDGESSRSATDVDL